MRGRSEGGAAAIEAAILLGLLVMLALGAFEYGNALRDRLSVSSASREGARIGAAAGPLVSPPAPKNADCLILEATSGALQNVASEEIVEVVVYQSDPAGGFGAANRYRPKQDTDDPVALTCGAAWFRTANGWPIASRDDEGVDRDWLGVRVVFDHQWETGFLWWNGSVRWDEDTIMRIEPAQD